MPGTCDGTYYRVYRAVTNVSISGSTITFDFDGSTWTGPADEAVTEDDYGTGSELLGLKSSLVSADDYSDDSSPARTLTIGQGTYDMASLYYAHLCTIDAVNLDHGGTIESIEFTPEGANDSITLTAQQGMDPCWLWPYHPDVIPLYPPPEPNDVGWMLLGENANLDLGGTYAWDQGSKWPASQGGPLPLRQRRYRIKLTGRKRAQFTVAVYGKSPSVPVAVNVPLRLSDVRHCQHDVVDLNDVNACRRAWMHVPMPLKLQRTLMVYLTEQFASQHNIPA
jgi:hypothetical protein